MKEILEQPANFKRLEIESAKWSEKKYKEQLWHEREVASNNYGRKRAAMTVEDKEIEKKKKESELNAHAQHHGMKTWHEMWENPFWKGSADI